MATIDNVILGQPIEPDWGNSVADEINAHTGRLDTIEANNWVTTARINADAINGTKIADDSIDSEHYVDGSIDTAHIGDGQVSNAKIASGVDASKLTTGTLPIARIADGAVTEAKLASAVLSSSATLLSAGTGWGSSSLYYKKIGNVVHVWGAMAKSATGSPSSNQVMATLPAGFRPNVQFYFVGYCLLGTSQGFIPCLVNTSGQLMHVGSMGDAVSTSPLNYSISFATS